MCNVSYYEKSHKTKKRFLLLLWRGGGEEEEEKEDADKKLYSEIGKKPVCFEIFPNDTAKCKILPFLV